jgi:VWFA-related protein
MARAQNRFWAVGTAVGVLSAAVALQPIVSAENEQLPESASTTFRAGVETVVVSVTVRDRSNHLVTTLGRDDFRLFVDGRPVHVDVFSLERRPLMLGILLSTSRESGVDRTRDIARALVDAIEPDEHAAIGTYANEIAISPFATSDRIVLNRVLDEEVWPGEGRPVNTAVAEMIRAMPKGRGKPAVVVVGSDFPESCGYRPCLADGDVRDLAQREEVIIYGLVNRTQQPPTQIGSLPVATLSKATGGGYIVLRRTDDLGSLMKQVAEGLRHQYLLGFTPPAADNRDHTVKVEVAKPNQAMARSIQKASRR